MSLFLFGFITTLLLPLTEKMMKSLRKQIEGEIEKKKKTQIQKAGLLGL